MVDRYSIRSGYAAREIPEYFDDDLGDVIWQPDVYEDAGRIAGRLGAGRIVDVGAGDGTKLAELHPAFEIIGVDYGANVERSSARFPFGSWRHHDLDTDAPLPISDDELGGAVVVCSDVIEHLRTPELLLAKLLGTLDRASAVLISTPERELWHGVRSDGPPRNRHHVREWSIREFGHILGMAGFEHVSMGLTPIQRSHRGAVHDRSPCDIGCGDSGRSCPAADRAADPAPETPVGRPVGSSGAHPAIRLTALPAWLRVSGR